MIEAVFFDVGGPIYDDRPGYELLLRLIRDERPTVSARDFWQRYDELRQAQRGHIPRALLRAFVPEDDVDRLRAVAREGWEYAASALWPDVAPTLATLAGGYRLGLVANQQRYIRRVMERDGIAQFFASWGVSAEVGHEKPDPRLFTFALGQLGTPPARAVMVGDRLDNDVAPARALGMKAIWLLRGEAPDDPTPEQRRQATACIRSLSELPGLLDGWK